VCKRRRTHRRRRVRGHPSPCRRHDDPVRTSSNIYGGSVYTYTSFNYYSSLYIVRTAKYSSVSAAAPVRGKVGVVYNTIDICGGEITTRNAAAGRYIITSSKTVSQNKTVEEMRRGKRRGRKKKSQHWFMRSLRASLETGADAAAAAAERKK